MKRLFILNGSHSEVTLIQEAKKLGYHVTTLGNCPELYGHRFSDAYINIDYSDKESVLQAANEKKIDAVISCANDFGIITASYVGERLGLAGHDPYDTTVLLHQKDLFKKFAMEKGLRVPQSRTFSDMDSAKDAGETLEYPVIVKPVDLTGGKGVSRADNEKEYLSAIENAFLRSRKKVIIVEQFIEGTYHSFSTFLVNQKVVGCFSDNEYSYVYRYFVDTSGGPADGVDKVKDLLIGQAETIAEELKLVDGVFHMQYVMDKKGNPYIMDITRRCSGDIYPEPVEHSTGIPWSKWIVMAEAGYPPESFKERGEQKGFCGRHCIMAETEGRVRDVLIDPVIKKYVYKEIQWWEPGYEIRNHQVDKAGMLFYEFPSREIMTDMIGNMKKLVHVVEK